MDVVKTPLCPGPSIQYGAGRRNLVSSSVGSTHHLLIDVRPGIAGNWSALFAHHRQCRVTGDQDRAWGMDTFNNNLKNGVTLGVGRTALVQLTQTFVSVFRQSLSLDEHLGMRPITVRAFKNLVFLNI